LKWREYRNKILSTIDAESFYVDEFEKRGLQYHRHGNELKSQCPFTELHLAGQDRNPSFTVNLGSGAYLCNACGSKGNIHTFYMVTRKLDKQEAWFELGDALGLERPVDVDSRPAIDPGLPVQYHRSLMESTGVIRDILRDKRGLTEATLSRFQIGWDNERVTIPVYDEFSELVNIRRYKWNSFEDSTKMINYTDILGNTYGEDRIYGIENLFDPEVTEIMWCEGEWDRLVAEQLGIPTCTATAGADNFRLEWFKLIKKKKRIYVCYDNDDAGRRATEYMVDNLRGGLEIYVVNWPKDWREKGDITDIIIKDGYDKEKFMQLFVPISSAEDVPIVSLAISSNARYTGKRIKIPVLVAGKDSAPFVYPKSVRLTCTEGSEDKKSCASCRLMTQKRYDVQLNSSSATMLKMIDCTDDQQRGLLKSLAGCNSKCFEADLNVLEYGNLESIHMIPKAEASFGFALRQEYVARMGYIMGNNLPTNKRFTLVGYMHADPNTQRATYIFDQAIPEKDLLDELEITPEVHEMLKEFQCAEGQTVEQKFAEIHADLERNVTYIWDRRRVAYAVDLVYHSVLSFIFQEQPVKRGWAECLIIGDSGQAKTTLVERLMQHYKSGELLSGESSKRTGLVYNLQQTGSKGNWSLMWGAMPLNDGGLLTVDELSGMPEDDLAKMSDVRSSGIAKATGVVTAETTSRTRMIFISNPRNGRQLRAENYGVSAVLKLWGKAEDVRRLDFAIAVASGEVDSDIVNKSISEIPQIEHRFTSDKCKMRVMWAWSRRPENVIFTPEATQAILENASKMGKKYSSRIPLVEPADQRLKLARLSVSTAACVYSTDDGTNVIVKPEHVKFVVDYLNAVYDSRALGYDRFSADEFENSDTTDAAMQRLRSSFISIPFASRSVMEVVKALYQMPYFNRNTLEDATGLDRDEIKNLLQFLISSSIVEKAGQDYKRSPLGLAFIEQLLTEPPTETEIRSAREKRYMNSEI
jgi:5S rRNA maturation endonuclease (ribonuclease M5)